MQQAAHRKPVDQITDRAKRYRAQATPPAGPRLCALCGSTRFLVIDHKDGDESNGARSNLRWLCKSCNTRLGARDARTGRGVRTRQFNPRQVNPGALTLAGYTEAALSHQRGAHDWGGAIIHDTPRAVRQKFAREIWRRRRGEAPRHVSLNPADMAEAIERYEMSHDRGPREILERQRSTAVRDTYVIIGEHPSLFELEIAGPDCDLESLDFRDMDPGAEIPGTIPLGFDRCKVDLATDPKGNSLYLIGGDQSLDGQDLALFGTDPRKDLIELGPAVSVTYRARKAPEFKLALYRHFLGEKSGEPPIAFYDAIKNEIGLAGGRYRVKDWIYD